MDHVAGPELAGVEQAGADIAPAAQAAGAPAEALPPIVLTPAVEAAIRRAVAASIARDRARSAWVLAVPGVVRRALRAAAYTAWRKAEADLATAATALVREVAGDPADRPDQ